MSKNITNLFDSVRIFRDGYSQKFNSIKKKYNDRVKQIENNYKGGLLAEEMAKARGKYESELEAARKEAADFVGQEIEKIRSEEIKKVSALPDSRIHILNELKDVPMTSAELGILKTNVGSDYWTQRMLAYIADRNAITDVEIEGSIDDRLDILSQIEESTTSFLANYNGSDTAYTVLQSLSDRQLFDMERSYTNDFEGIALNPQQMAQRVATMVSSEPNAIAAGLRLKNVLKTTDDWTKTLIFEALEKHNQREDVILWANAQKTAQAYNDTGKNWLRKSRSIMRTLSEFESETDIGAALDQVSDSKGLRRTLANLLKDEIESGNITLAKGCGLSEIPEFQQLVEPQKIV